MSMEKKWFVGQGSAAVDTLLFFVSFGIQRDWVFGKGEKHERS